MKLEDITIPDSSSIPWVQVASVAIVMIILGLMWSRPILRYGMIGAAILAGFLIVAKQGGWT